MKDTIVIIAIFIERIAFAVIGLIAGINGETWWSIIMTIVLFLMVFSTKIKVGDKK